MRKANYIIPFECHDCGAKWFANTNRSCSHDTTPFERLIENYNWFPTPQFGIVTRPDGSRFFARHGVLTEILPEDESEIKCTRCTWTGFDMDLVCIDYAPDGSTYACPVCEAVDDLADIPIEPVAAVSADPLAQLKQGLLTTCLCCFIGGVALGFYIATVLQGGAK
jgi:hypothetical protein